MVLFIISISGGSEFKPMPQWLSPRLGLALSFLGIAQIINWGVTYYTLALIGPHIVTETGWSEAFVYSGFAIATIIMGLASPFSGQAVDRLGGAPVMAIGTLVGVIGVALLAFAYDPIIYMVAWGVIGLAMSACLYDTSFAAIARFAGQATRQAISSMTLIAGFSSTIIWPLTAYLLAHFSWREVVLIDAAMMAFISMPLLLIGLNERAIKEAQKHHIATRTANDTGSVPLPQKPLLDEKDFTLAMILFAFVLTAHGFVVNAMSVHVITIFTDLGIDHSAAVLAGALIGPAQVASRLLELLFGKRLSAIALGLVAVLLLPLSFLIPVLLPASLVMAASFGLAYGASNGLATIMRGVVPHALFGPEGYGRRLGLIAGPPLLIKAVSPAVFAFVIATTGPHGALILAIVSGVLAAIAMIALALQVRRATA